jgi:hypothetical protein
MTGLALYLLAVDNIDYDSDYFVMFGGLGVG